MGLVSDREGVGGITEGDMWKYLLRSKNQHTDVKTFAASPLAPAVTPEQLV